MNNPKFRISFLLMSVLVFVLACGIPAATSTEVAETEAPAATDAPTESAPSPIDATPDIQHTDFPINLPENQSGQAGDFDSSKVLENKTLIGGDRFTYGRFERPFNANTMDIYFSQLDIVDTKVHQDDNWIYGTIILKELSQSSSESEKYAIELDTTLDGKGDWLIVTNKPETTDWTVNNVRIYKDENKDVGGEMPALTDNTPVDGDGFEALVFDQGVGDDADSAWVRLSPNNSNAIEFAIKKTAIENPTQFMINMWAGTGILDTVLFDLNDNFTHEQAGAADAGLEFFYPIKEVTEIDNSCRMAVGFQPNGTEPGICPVPQKEQQGNPVPPGSSCPANTFLFCSQNGCFCFPILIVTFPTEPPPVP